MPGRKPKPTKLKLLHGNPGKRPLNDQEPEPEPVKSPSPPRHLDGRAKYFWRVLVKELEPLGIISRIDLQALARYCHLYSTWRQAEDLQNERGITIRKKALDKNGEVHILDEKIAPWVNIADKASKEMRAIESAIGMGGAANRAKIKVEKPKKSNPFGRPAGKRSKAK